MCAEKEKSKGIDRVSRVCRENSLLVADQDLGSYGISLKKSLCELSALKRIRGVGER